MPDRVTAVVIPDLGGPDSVEVREIDRPTRGDGEVLVAVAAVAPAFPDLLLSRGEYQVTPDLPFSPGSDFAGVVLESEPGAVVRPGQRVAGCLLYGAAAELVSVAPELLYPLPDSMSFATAAALPMNYLTAYYALKSRGQATAGDRVLVTGASGGVGVAAIQVAKGLGCSVIAVVSGEHRRSLAESAGADVVVLADELPARIREVTHQRGVDVVVDVVGGDVTNLLRVLAPLGRLMIVGFASGQIPTIKVNRLLLTNTDVRGVDSARLIFETGDNQPAWTHLMEMADAGHLRPAIRSGGDLRMYATTLHELAARSGSGRVVLTTDPTISDQTSTV